jgi:hypothetical protein
MAANSKYVEVQIRGSSVVTSEPTSKRIYNVFHFTRASVATAWNKTSFFNAFNTNVLTPMLAALSVNYNCIACDIRAVDDPTDQYTIFPVGTPGAISGDNLPSLNCAIALMDTGMRGRSNHGRKYFALVAESDSLQDRLTSAALTRYNAILTAYLAGFTDSLSIPWTPFLLSRTKSNLILGAPIIGAAPISASTETILGKLKRRQEPKT